MLLKCRRCDKCKTQEHVIQCEAAKNDNEVILIQLRAKIEKKSVTEDKKNSIEHTMKDMYEYLLLG